MLEVKGQLNALGVAQQVKNSGGSGSDVTVTQVLESGTKIATITVDEESTDLYCETVPSTYDADDVDYDNTESGLTATDVQDAIDEINSKDAGDISYDNTSSGLTATNVQDAIDEVAQGGGSTGYSLIWTNADTTQVIDTTTPLSIADADEYTDFVFEMVASDAYTNYPIMVSAANLGSITNQVGYPVISGGTTGYVYRNFTTTSSSMILDVPKIKSLSAWTDTAQTASYYIPVKIYGKK